LLFFSFFFLAGQASLVRPSVFLLSSSLPSSYLSLLTSL
uniref:Uncharacterized protein n=1 Tax=Amphimedon queenslandica TaxID=400682 RepID=A0A1X7U1S0_AMPQE